MAALLSVGVCCVAIGTANVLSGESAAFLHVGLVCLALFWAARFVRGFRHGFYLSRRMRRNPRSAYAYLTALAQQLAYEAGTREDAKVEGALRGQAAVMLAAAEVAHRATVGEPTNDALTELYAKVLDLAMATTTKTGETR